MFKKSNNWHIENKTRNSPSFKKKFVLVILIVIMIKKRMVIVGLEKNGVILWSEIEKSEKKKKKWLQVCVGD